jgi:hypothetical protein
MVNSPDPVKRASAYEECYIEEYAQRVALEKDNERLKEELNFQTHLAEQLASFPPLSFKKITTDPTYSIKSCTDLSSGEELNAFYSF